MVALKSYEGMFLLDNRFASREWSECEKDLRALFDKHKGEVLRIRKWGERRLAYEIKGHKRATYLLTYFNMPPENLTAFRRDMELSENVIRNLVLYRAPEILTELLAAEDREISRAEESARAVATRPVEGGTAVPAPEAPPPTAAGDTPA